MKIETNCINICFILVLFESTFVMEYMLRDE